MIRINMHSDLMKIMKADSGFKKEEEFVQKLCDASNMITSKCRYFAFVEEPGDKIPLPVGLIVYDPAKVATAKYGIQEPVLEFVNTEYDDEYKTATMTQSLILEWRELNSLHKNICYYELCKEHERPKGIKRTTKDLADYRSHCMHIRFKEYWNDGKVAVLKTHSNLKKKDVVDYGLVIPVFVIKETYSYFRALQVINSDINNNLSNTDTVIERPMQYFECDYKEGL